jgi:hypothetical protein
MRAAIGGLSIALITAIGLTLRPFAARTADATGCVRIYEIYYDSPGSDYGSNSSLNGEWARLKNVCSTGKSLYHWTLRDAAGHVYTFGSYTLKAYSYVKIHTGKGTNTSTDRYWGKSWYVWNNDKDTAYLRNSAGTLMASCSYNSTAVDYKYC